MRVFIGIELPLNIRTCLGQAQDDLRADVQAGRFTRPENFHLTLRFLGEITDEQLAAVHLATERTARAYVPFHLTLGALGVFKKKNRFILWAGVDEGVYHLERVFKILEAELEPEGFEKDSRGLNPHITIGRQIKLSHELESSIEAHRAASRLSPDRFRVNRLTVFESKRIDNVLRYEPIASFNLSR